jgi:hypothetical protein
MCTPRVIQHLIKKLSTNQIEFKAKVVNEENDIKSRVDTKRNFG